MVWEYAMHDHFKDIETLFAQGRPTEARHLLMDMEARYIALRAENSTLRMLMHEYEDVIYLARHLKREGDCSWLAANAPPLDLLEAPPGARDGSDRPPRRAKILPFSSSSRKNPAQ